MVPSGWSGNWGGFSFEIETKNLLLLLFYLLGVATGAASRLRLKHMRKQQVELSIEVATGAASRLRLKQAIDDASWCPFFEVATGAASRLRLKQGDRFYAHRAISSAWQLGRLLV